MVGTFTPCLPLQWLWLGGLFSIPRAGLHISYSCRHCWHLWHCWLCQQAPSELQQTCTPELDWHFHCCWFSNWEPCNSWGNLKWACWPGASSTNKTIRNGLVKPKSRWTYLFSYSYRFINTDTFSRHGLSEMAVPLHEYVLQTVHLGMR